MEASSDLRSFELKVSNMRSTGRVSFAGRGQNWKNRGRRVLGSRGRGEFKVGAKTAASSRTGDRKNFSAKRNSNLPEPQLLLFEQKIYKTSMDITMTESGTSSSRQGQVQVHFITNSADIELPEGKRQLLVPTSEYNSNPTSISSFD